MKDDPIMRRGLSSASLILAVAAFVAFFSNAAFFTSVVNVYGVSARSAPFIASLFCFITSLFVLILSTMFLTAIVAVLFLYWQRNQERKFGGSSRSPG